MLWQLQLYRIAQKGGAEYHGVHHKVLIDAEEAAAVPIEDAILGEDALIVHSVLLIVLYVLVYVVAEHKVNVIAAVMEAAQAVHNDLECLNAEPVIRVHDLEIDARGVAKALIYALTVAAVLLMDNADDARKLFCVRVGDLARVIGGAVVDYNDLGVLACGQQSIQALFHICRGVIAGHGKSDILHKILLNYGRGDQIRLSQSSRALATMASIL